LWFPNSFDQNRESQKQILRREIAKPSLSAYSCRSDTRTMPVRGNTMQDS